MTRIRRLATALAGLVLAWFGLAIAAPAAFAAVPPPGGGPPGISVLHEPPGGNKHPPLPPGHVTGPVHQIRTVVVGGMPGWRIALIAAAAALIAATVAVLLDRARARRKSAAAAAWAEHSQTDTIGAIN